MLRLLRLLVPPILKVQALSALVFLVLIANFTWLFDLKDLNDAGLFVAIVFPVMVGCLFYFNAGVFRANRSWIVTLPLPRWKILAASVMVDALGFTVLSVAALGAVLLSVIWMGKFPELMAHLRGTGFWAAPFATVKNLNFVGSLARLSLVRWEFVFFILGGYLICGPISGLKGDELFGSDGVLPFGLFFGTKTEMSSFRRWGRTVTGLLLTVLVSTLLIWLPSPFSFALVCLIECCFIAFGICQVFLLPRKKWVSVAVFCVLAMVSMMAFLFVLSAQKLTSNDLRQKSQALAFLGPLAKVNLPQLAKTYLESDLDPGQLSDFQRDYAEIASRTSGGQVSEMTTGVDFKTAVESKTDKAVKAAIFALFPTSRLKIDDIRFYVGQFDENSFRCEALSVEIARVPIAKDIVPEFLSSHHKLSNCVGLYMLRYFPSELGVQTLRGEFRGYSDSLKLTATVTLSILASKHLDLTSVFNWAERVVFDSASSPLLGNSFASRDSDLGEEVDTGNRTPGSSGNGPCAALMNLGREQWSEANVGRLNRCIRELVPPNAVEDRLFLEAEQGGWIVDPLSISNSKFLRRYGFHFNSP